MMQANDDILDEARTLLPPIGGVPRQKRRKATITSEPIVIAPSAATDPAKKAGKKKAVARVNTIRLSPSSSTSPRKRGRPAKRGSETAGKPPGVNNSDGQASGETLSSAAIGSGRADHSGNELHSTTVSASLVHIIQLWRMRQRWHRAEKALILQSKAICRAFLAGDKDAASAAYDEARKGGGAAPEIAMALLPFLPAIERFEAERKAIEKDLIKTAKTLPAYQWMKGIRGFGELNFVAVIGESSVIEEDGSVRGPGDYKTVSALWKRMGVALVGEERQRKVADAELAILHGYNPSRRSVLFNVGECLIKAGGDYKAIYDDRKAYEMARDPEMRPIHAHRRAARYMTKRLLRKLYAQWRLETRGESGDPESVAFPMAAE